MRVSAEVVARRVDEKIVLVHLGSDQIYSLNVTGGRYWELLAEQLDPDAIVSTLVAEFDIDETSVRDEIARLTSDLLHHGLVVGDPHG